MKPQILVNIGTGGVGKTTLAAVFAIQKAQEGYRTLVLTIDPSQRLAQALGLQKQTSAVKIPGSFKGELSARIIDHKSVFDDFVKEATQKSELAIGLLSNRLYQQLTTTLSGSQEFTALETLYQAYQSGQYDYIILDTPPAQHAIDFLEAPQKLAAVFNESVAQWFRGSEQKSKSLWMSLLSTGTQKVLKALETLTGAAFIRELSEFFMLIESWQSRLLQRVHDFHRLLVDPQTQFVLVTVLEPAKLKEAQQIGRDIQKNGYHLQCIYLNRVPPSADMGMIFTKMSPEILTEIQRLQKQWQQRESMSSKLLTQFQNELGLSLKFVRVEEQTHEISDLKGLIELAHSLAKGK